MALATCRLGRSALGQCRWFATVGTDVIREQTPFPPFIAGLQKGLHGDFVDLVKDDHKHIRDIYHDFIQQRGSPQGVQLLNRLLWTIARHNAGEEIVLNHVLTRLGYGHLAEKSHEDHFAIMEKFRAESDTALLKSDTIDSIMRELDGHFRVEEGAGGELELVRKGCEENELAVMGFQFEKTKLLAPSAFGLSFESQFRDPRALMCAKAEQLRKVLEKIPDDVLDSKQ